MHYKHKTHSHTLALAHIDFKLGQQKSAHKSQPRENIKVARAHTPLVLIVLAYTLYTTRRTYRFAAFGVWRGKTSPVRSREL